MADHYVVLSLCPTQCEADKAVVALEAAGFDIRTVPFASTDVQAGVAAQRAFAVGTAIHAKTAEVPHREILLGGLLGTLFGVGILIMPGMASLIIVESIVGVLAGLVEGLVLGASGAAIGSFISTQIRSSLLKAELCHTPLK
jgi:hypothetical protein